MVEINAGVAQNIHGCVVNPGQVLKREPLHPVDHYLPPNRCYRV
jgi:hypothetical protein